MSHKLFIAINGDIRERAYENMCIAMETNVDGVILFNDKLPAEQLATTCSLLLPLKPTPEFKLGVRFSNCEPQRSFELVPKDADILWIRTHTDKSILQINRVEESFFPGQCFLSINPRYDPRTFMELAHAIFIESTTSGVEPQISVVRKARALVGDHPLGVANGMHPANLGRFVEHVNYFIVQSSVTTPDGKLSAHRIERLLECVHHVHA